MRRLSMVMPQIHRALPWLLLALSVVLAACTNGGSGGSGPGY
jgi:predicted small secreted protein